MADINPHWDDYILWLATPDGDRGEVATEDAWAKSKGYSDSRTQRRWKKNPAFLERQRVLSQKLAAKTGAILVSDSDDSSLDAEERDYLIVKSKLVQQAKEGNLKAQELYMKQYGKSWVDEETAARTSDYSNLELPGLVARAAAAVEPSILAEALRELGWAVTEPGV